MHDEIEIKLKYSDEDKIREKFKEIKAKFKEKFELYDIYLSNEYDSMAEAKRFIRIRKKGKKVELTYKGDKKEDSSGIWNRAEINIPLTNEKDMIKILKNLKFKIIKENKSIRECWEFEGNEIIVTKIILPSELNFIEIEGKSEKEVMKVRNLFGNLVSKLSENAFKILDK